MSRTRASCSGCRNENKQAYRDRLDVLRLERTHGIAQRRLVERAQHVAAEIDPLLHLAGEARRHQRRRLVVHDVEDRRAVGAGLLAHGIDAAKSLRHQQSRSGRPCLRAARWFPPWCRGRNSRFRPRSVTLAKRASSPARIARDGSSGVEGNLRDRYFAGLLVEMDEIRECAAGIDGDAVTSHAMIGFHASEQRQAIRTWRLARVKGHYPLRVATRPQRCEQEDDLDSADFDALEEKARAGLSPAAYAFAAAGADDEITRRRRTSRRGGVLRLRPRVLNDVTQVDTSVSILGSGATLRSWSPRSGATSCFIPKASGPPRAARPRPAPSSFCRPHRRSASKTWRAEPGSAPRWFQLYLPPERALAENLIDRAAAAGFRAVVLTVDQPVYGSSPRAARAPLTASPDIRNANLPGQPIAQTFLQGGPHRLGDVSGDLARPRMAGAAFGRGRRGEGRPARRRCRALPRSRGKGDHRLEPRRPPSRRHRRDR